MMKRRLMRGIGAQAVGQAISLAIQVCTIPLFMHYWGKALYGEWLLLTTIPTYFALSDLGFANAAGSEMTMRVARQDYAGALKVFQSAWALVSVVSLLVCLIALAVVSALPVRNWLHLRLLSENEVRLLLPILVFQVFFAIQRGLIGIGYRCDGNFAVGVMVGNGARLVAFGAMALAVALGGGARQAALAFLIAEIVTNLYVVNDVRRRSPWLQHGVRYIDAETLRALAVPAISFMGFPIGNALSLQGTVMMIGIVLGPSAVVGFSTLRTLSRFASQALGAITNTVWVELSAAFGAGDLALARRLHRSACQMSLWLSLTLCGLLWIFGRTIFERWTGGKVEFDASLFALLLLVIICNSLWSASYIVAAAMNKHQFVALIYVVAAAASVGLGALLTRWTGIHGAAVALLIIDMAMIALVTPNSLKIVEDDLIGFARTVATPPIDSLGRALGRRPATAV